MHEPFKHNYIILEALTFRAYVVRNILHAFLIKIFTCLKPLLVLLL